MKKETYTTIGESPISDEELERFERFAAYKSGISLSDEERRQVEAEIADDAELQDIAATLDDMDEYKDEIEDFFSRKDYMTDLDVFEKIFSAALKESLTTAVGGTTILSLRSNDRYAKKLTRGEELFDKLKGIDKLFNSDD